ncbi:hypothetical protein ILYODFUR_012585 [Ilyodon furcidens]|uniref:Uncharacterized protein n=1 Tax=Ilyodon furcidens TaxID=33524 RepID=A0ABV0SP29_9TELE
MNNMNINKQKQSFYSEGSGASPTLFTVGWGGADLDRGHYWVVEAVLQGSPQSCHHTFPGELDSFINQAEVSEVVKKLHGGKASGVDEIRPEYLWFLESVF